MQDYASTEVPNSSFELIGLHTLNSLRLTNGEAARTAPVIALSHGEDYSSMIGYFDYLGTDEVTNRTLYINYHFFLDNDVERETLLGFKTFLENYSLWMHYSIDDFDLEFQRQVLEQTKTSMVTWLDSLSPEDLESLLPLIANLWGTRFVANSDGTFGSDMFRIFDMRFSNYFPTVVAVLPQDIPEIDFTLVANRQSLAEQTQRMLLGLHEDVTVLAYTEQAMIGRGQLYPEEEWVFARGSADEDSATLADVNKILKTVLHEDVHGFFLPTGTVEYQGREMPTTEFYFRLLLNTYEDPAARPIVKEIARSVLYGSLDPALSNEQVSQYMQEHMINTDYIGIGLLKNDDGSYTRITSENVDEEMSGLLSADRTRFYNPSLGEIMPSLVTGVFQNCVAPIDLTPELHEVLSSFFAPEVMSNVMMPISLSVISSNLESQVSFDPTELPKYEAYLQMGYFEAGAALNALTHTNHGLPSLMVFDVFMTALRHPQYWRSPLVLDSLNMFSPHENYFGISIGERAYNEVWNRALESGD